MISFFLGISFVLFMLKSFYMYWLEEFGHKLRRGNEECPSNKRRPVILNDKSDPSAGADKDKIVKERRGTAIYQWKSTREVAGELDMDHIWISFGDYLLIIFLVGTSSTFNFMSGFCFWKTREFVGRILNWTFPCDYDSVAFEFCMSTSFAINYVKSTVDENGCEIGLFTVPEFAWVTDNLDYGVDVLDCYLNFTERKFHSGRMGSRDIDAKTMLLFQYMRVLAAQHVHIHALANWSCNTESHNIFVKWMSKVTVMYNFFGWRSFTKLLWFLSWSGGLTRIYLPIDNDEFETGVDYILELGRREGIKEHKNLIKIRRYSEFVDFIFRLRPFFLKTFERYRSTELIGVDGEALFIGTVVHSLDHALAGDVVYDYMWFEQDEWQWMVELCRVVRCGFSNELPFIAFANFYSQTDEEFYRIIYAEAMKINAKYASYMQCCIIR